MCSVAQQARERSEANAWVRNLVKALIDELELAYPSPNLCEALEKLGGKIEVANQPFNTSHEGPCKKTSDGGFVIRYSAWKGTLELNRKNLEIARCFGYLVIFQGLLIDEKQWNAVIPEKWMGNTISLSFDQNNYLNYFASQLIMPEHLLVQEIDKNMMNDVYLDGKRVAKHFNVPISFVSIRAQKLHR